MKAPKTKPHEAEPNQPGPDGQIRVVDILAMELDQKLPYWLSPQEKFKHTHDADRKAKHAKYQAEVKAKRAKGKGKDEKAYDESQHPRDEHGRWTDSGGGDAGGDKPGKPESDGEHASAEQKLTKIVDSVPGAHEKIQSARAQLKTSVATDKPLSEGGYKRSNGQYAPARQAAHAKIMEDTFTPERVAAATPKEGEQPVVHLLGGSGGSGKGWFTGPKGTVNKQSAIYLNSDDVKAALPNYHGWNAAIFHEESSYLTELMEKTTVAGKLNVIIDGTMGSLQKLEKRIDDYRKAGYRIEGHFMRVTPETSTKRALERFMRGGEKGRFVPPELLLKHAATQNFEKASAKMDAWEMYDNEGSAPKFVKRG